MNYCPQLEDLHTYQYFNNNFTEYENYLYSIFLKDLFNMKIFYKGKPVSLKRYPIYNNKEESFYHLTCKNYNGDSSKRDPDFRRSERLHWIKPSIETEHSIICKQNCFLVYEKETNNKIRTHLLNKEDRYLIILEERNDYYLLITAFYIEYDNALDKKVKDYENYKNSLK